MNTKQWMIYGANGYTGRLCVCEALRRHMRPILGGRNAQEVEQMARDFSLEARVFDLSDPALAASRMQDVDTVLNCAGPFSATARPMLEACVLSKTNYLDITGEIEVFEFVHNHPEKWLEAGIAAIPGVGFDIVPTDCLAAMLKEALPDASRLVLAFKSTAMKLSPGTAKTVAEGITDGCRIRRDGYIMEIPLGSKTQVIPFDSGQAQAVAISWGDVSTAYYTTGIPDIEVYMASSAHDIKQLQRLTRFRWLFGMGLFQRLLQRVIATIVKGPNETERAASRMELYGEVSAPDGQQAIITMQTPDGYDVTYDAAVSAVENLLSGKVGPGAHTPGQAFGAEFVLSLRGVTSRRVH